ncbi:right-handed parallel beta-helix repeat-containing protein [Planctomycetota bacterium]
MADVSNPKIQRAITIVILIALFVLSPVRAQLQNGRPVADAGSSRYAATDPVQLDGTGSYDPDNSGTLSYTWRQISGPAVVITDANTAKPTIAGSMKPGTGRDPTAKPEGFPQTDEVQECEFELVVSDSELTSLPDAVKVIIVPDFGTDTLWQENPPFDRNKPTLIFFGGGDCVTGRGSWNSTVWAEKANIISFTNYGPDVGGGLRTYYQCGDMIIVYLSSVAPNYKQPIQTIGYSTGGDPAVDVGIHLNRVYRDARYAVNRVTELDAPCRWSENRDFYFDSDELFLTSAVDGEQCWIDDYYGLDSSGAPRRHFTYRDDYKLAVALELRHGVVHQWYRNSLTGNDMNKFNSGVVAGAYWSVIGPGKNLQLAPQIDAFYFRWDGNTQSGGMSFYDEALHPGNLPEPVTLVGPENDSFVDVNGALFSCEESENASGYQLLFGPDPHRVLDYYIVSDTLSPPSEVIIASPFEQTWWTVKVYDQYGSTIYADPVQVNFENLAPPLIENITTGQRYAYIRLAINDARNGHEIVVSPGVHQEKIDFKGKNLTLRSTDPNDLAVVSETIITADGDVVTFSGGEDANCVLTGFTITGGKRGIYCSGSSPTITNCTVVGNRNADMGAGMYIKDGSSPTLANCTFIDNLASLMGGGMYIENSSPILINCTFAGNSATYFSGGIYCGSGSPVLTNCILWGDTPEEIYIFSGTPVITYSDAQGGFIGEGNIDADPLFADPSNGDYHLKSQAGRWDPINQSWIQDDVTSPCIDAGDPTSSIDLEPSPNGDRINMGAYGGTSEASKSP